MDFEILKNECAACRKCALAETRTNIVFGVGKENADLMFVGEAPGADEDASGIPFVGRAGKLLNSYLDAVGISRDDVYIANILKCRPPKNRDPLPEESDACMPYLREQVKLIKPRFIVCLGRIAAMRLIKSDYKITQEHGIWVSKGQFEMTAFFHPSALLRDPRKKDAMLDDMKVLAEKLKSN